MVAKVLAKYEKKIKAAEVSARMKRIALGLLRLRIRSRPEKEMSDEQVLAAREFHRTGDFSYRSPWDGRQERDQGSRPEDCPAPVQTRCPQDA